MILTYEQVAEQRATEAAKLDQVLAQSNVALPCPLTCGQCDFYFASKVKLGLGCCTITENAKRSTAICTQR